MRAYWLGFFTVPVILFFGAFFLVVIVNLSVFLEKHGWDVEFKISRNTEEIDDFTVKHDIWYEKQHGPVFTGHWYFERGGEAFANRWFAIGNRNGTALMFFKKRNLGLIKKEDK